jgi:hypothetical protein
MPSAFSACFRYASFRYAYLSPTVLRIG